VKYGAVIVDIDNCISDDRWRLKYLDAIYAEHGLGIGIGKWHVYNSLAPYDEPANQLKFLKEMTSLNDPPVIFSTARPEIYRVATQLWLERHFGKIINFGALMMRQSSDTRIAAEVKRDNMFVALRELKLPPDTRQILKAYEDDHQTQAMYLAEGIKTVNVNILTNSFQEINA